MSSVTAAAVRAPAARANRAAPAAHRGPTLPARGVKAQAHSSGGGPSLGATAARKASDGSGLRRRWSDATTAPSGSNPTLPLIVPSAASAAAPAPAADAAEPDSGETAAIINVVKSIFGAGGFALPWAFAQEGPDRC